MLKKIILPLVLLIFTHQEFYGAEINNSSNEEGDKINNKVTLDKNYIFWSGINDKYIRCLKYLWVFLDNVPFQYGSSKILKHGEVYYGLSNGIGFSPSFLNFKWLKIEIGDVHINVINAIINYIRIYVEIKFDYYFKQANSNKNKHEYKVWFNSLKWWLLYTVVTDIHLLSFKILNCVKIKIISIGTIVTCFITGCYTYDEDYEWFFNFNFKDGKILTVSKNYLIFSPRIEINISEIIKFFNEE